MTIVLAIVAGALLGYVLERGDLCFHATWRGILSRPRETDLVRSYLLLLLLATPIVQLLLATGAIDPFIPPLNPVANIGGGVVFGIGMVVAATCTTGMFYKFGHGMLGTAVALIGWIIGDVFTYRGPLSGLRNDLASRTVSVDGDAATVNSLTGGAAISTFAVVAVLLALGVATARYLFRGRELPGARVRGSLWGWIRLGVALTAVTCIAWLLVTIEGSDYAYGTSGVPAALWDRVTGAGNNDGLWIPVALVSITPGAFVAARRAGTLWVRGETTVRYIQLGVGGLIMGVGAAIAGGCNVGHSMIGVPLLSLGSIATTAAMIGGVFIGDRLIRAARTRRRRLAAAGVG